jgi:hypothetical protein
MRQPLMAPPRFRPPTRVLPAPLRQPWPSSDGLRPPPGSSNRSARRTQCGGTLGKSEGGIRADWHERASRRAPAEGRHGPTSSPRRSVRRPSDEAAPLGVLASQPKD